MKHWLCANVSGGLSKYIQVFRPVLNNTVVHYGFHLYFIIVQATYSTKKNRIWREERRLVMWKFPKYFKVF